MSVSKKFTKDNKVTVTFTIKKTAAQNAKKIDLLCEHNGWQPVAMKPQKNGTFKGSITVKAGLHISTDLSTPLKTTALSTITTGMLSVM